MRRYSVPYITETTDIFEVDAKSGADAVLKAEELRRAGTTPTHSHTSKFAIGSVKPTLTVDPTAS